jgi:amino acid permease
LRHLNGLRYVAAMALSVCIWAAVMTIMYYTQGSTHFQPCGSSFQPYLKHEQMPCGDAHVLSGPASWQQFGKYACTIVLAYCCQMNVFTVFNEMKEASANRADRVVTAAHVIAGAVYCIVGFFAYATYGEKVMANLLMAYPRDMPMAVTRFFYTLVAVVSYPIIMNPCRVATLGLWRYIRTVLHEIKLPLPMAFTASADEDEKPAIESDLEFYSVNFLLLAVSLVVALTVEDLGIVFAVFGATAGVTLSFVIPSFMYMRAFNEHHPKRHLATGLFCFGCVLAPVCFVCALIR